MTFEERLKETMKERGMNQKELAQKSGISEASLCRYLQGVSQPRRDIVINLSKALNVDVIYLLFGEQKTVDTYEETKQVVARNRSTLSDKEKTQIIQILLGGKI